MSEKPLTSPPLPWRTKLFLSFVSAVTDASRRYDGTVNRRFLNFLNPCAPANAKPLHGVKTADVTIDPSRNLWARLFCPASSAAPLPVVVFFHGGGFAFLSPDSKGYDAVCRRLSSAIPAIVVSVNYRLSPEHPHPAPYDDGLDAVRWLDSLPSALSAFAPAADLSRLFLMGDSAGGNLAHHVAERISASPAQFRAASLLGLVAVQPFFGGEERTPSELHLPHAPLVSLPRTDWLWRAFLPSGSDRDHEACNVFGPRRSAELPEAFPATLVFVGGFDPLQDWQRRYAEGLKRYGKEVYLVEYPSAVHAFYVFPELPESPMLMTEVKDFITKQCNKIIGK